MSNSITLSDLLKSSTAKDHSVISEIINTNNSIHDKPHIEKTATFSEFCKKEEDHKYMKIIDFLLDEIKDLKKEIDKLKATNRYDD
jgi:hypothetical protein